MYIIRKYGCKTSGSSQSQAAKADNFLYFLDKNEALFVDGKKRIADAALMALTIMIAESRVEEKEMIIRIIMNCLYI